MMNIWAFLLQTLTVSLVAALLLFLKWLFQDKLSPRWQYGVWIILMLRIIFPVQMDRMLLFNLPVWVETWKCMVEQNLQSAYSGAFTALQMYRIIPTIDTAPVSITDWLFVIYVVGIVVVLFWYVISYMRLRLLLRRGEPISYEQQQAIANVCKKYELTACKTVAVQGLPSAFVCGALHPILALPVNETVDEKIILHELLHLKYRDALRNVGWSVLRAFHWCNPFMHVVFRRIGNDIESLCDQRVLERLEGEERRAYGNILLDMANNQYARAPGTTSISNGGKNISRRIAAIVRFKKYPQGMALVSVCIVLVLAVPALAGTEMIYSQNDYEPKRLHELDKAMAMARLNRCETVAAALDTYAKGLLLENGIYIATVTPTYYHEELYQQMRKSNMEGGWMVNHLDSGEALEHVVQDSEHDYAIYSLEKIDNGKYDNRNYTAILVLKNFGVYTEPVESAYHNEAVFIPVKVYDSPGGYTVRETGERVVVPHGCDARGNVKSEFEPVIAELSAQGEYGTIRIQWSKRSIVENNLPRNGMSYIGGDFFKEFRHDSPFFDTNIMRNFEYDMTTKQIAESPSHSVGFQVRFVWDDTKPLPVLDSYMGGGISYFSDDLIKACQYIHNKISGVDWDGTVQCRSSDNGWSRAIRVGDTEENLGRPDAYLIGIYWDGKLVEELLIEEGDVYHDISRETE